MKVKLINLLNTYEKLKESEKASNFEMEFIKSLVYNANRYCRLIPNDVFHSANRDNILKLSDKQLKIYLSIKEKYNPNVLGNDLYTKYTLIFKEKGIILDNFDLRHLNTFKGVVKESDNFKKWVNEIIKELEDGEK